MFQLPDINAMNKAAVESHRKRKGKPPSPRGKPCEFCSGKSKHMIAYFDLFGDAKTRDIPKGYIPICEECWEKGSLSEGYFDCDGCTKMFVTNYTWECYYRDTDAGRLCLECAFLEALQDPEFWVYQEDLDYLKELLAAGKAKQAFQWLQRKAKHLIGVRMTYWEDHLIFQGNVELDSWSGARITGSSSTEPTVEGGVREIVDKLEKVLVNTTMRDFLVTMGKPPANPRCALIIDAVYQFAVSIGIYFEKKYSVPKKYFLEKTA
jgi:hypothetical protein